MALPLQYVTDHPRSRLGNAHFGCRSLFSISILSLLMLLSLSRAQDTIATVPITNELPAPTTSKSNAMTSASSWTTITNIAMSTNTTFPPTSSPTNPSHQSGYSSSDDDDADDPDPPDRDLFNYYFLFLLIFALLVAGLIWWIRHKKQRQTARMQASGHHALARDMEGWTTTRRFIYGRQGRSHAATQIRREDGLNEHGEAPPPYQQKSEFTISSTPQEWTQDSNLELPIPLRTLPKDRGRMG